MYVYSGRLNSSISKRYLRVVPITYLNVTPSSVVLVIQQHYSRARGARR